MTKPATAYNTKIYLEILQAIRGDRDLGRDAALYAIDMAYQTDKITQIQARLLEAMIGTLRLR